MASFTNGSTSPKRYLLLSSPRTASHLLMRMMGLYKQPQMAVYPDEVADYFFLPALYGRLAMGNYENHVQDLTECERSQLMEIYQSCADRMEAWVQEFEAQGKTLYLKEHAQVLLEPVSLCRFTHQDPNITEKPWTVRIGDYDRETHAPGNITLLPDDFLLSWKPAFLIRHPALAFPSLCRAYGDVRPPSDTGSPTAYFKGVLSLRPVRELYEWYREQLKDNEWPIVIDANDIIHNPAVVAEYCKRIGLDPASMVSTWGKTNPSGNPAADRFIDTLAASTGIEKDKAPPNIDLDVEAEKWRTEFGEEVGTLLVARVKDSLPDYEYLKSKRLQAAV